MNATLRDPRFKELLKEIEGRGGLSGLMEGVSLPELVQLACLEGKNRAIHLSKDGAEGVIYCMDGDVVHAEIGSLVGTDAFFELMLWENALFHYLPGSTATRSITAPYNFLLIEASRLMDENRKRGRQDQLIRLLIVDDSDFMCKALTSALKERLDGAEIHTASHGQEALNLLMERHPHLVTLDMNMPVMDGDMALKHIMIRSPAPVILVSGLDQGAMPRAMEFLRLGAIDFVPKPESGEGIEPVADRIAALARRAKALKVVNARRAKRVPPAGRKIKPSTTVEGIAIFLGGVGSLLEVSKVVPHLPDDEDIAVLFVLDVVERLAAPLAHELDPLSPLHVRPLEGVDSIQGGTAIICPISTPVQLCQEEGCWRPLAVGEAESGIAGLIRSCAEGFGVGCALFVLSGAEIPEDAVEHLVSRGGRMLIQEPSCCIDEESTKRIKDLGLDDGMFLPEAIAEPLEAWRRAFRHALGHRTSGDADGPQVFQE